MSVEFDRGSPGKFDSRTLNRETLDRWTGRRLYQIIVKERARGLSAAGPRTWLLQVTTIYVYIYIYIYITTIMTII